MKTPAFFVHLKIFAEESGEERGLQHGKGNGIMFA